MVLFFSLVPGTSLVQSDDQYRSYLYQRRVFTHTRRRMRAIVVGNGHLSERDRRTIRRHAANGSKCMVVRFNDMKSWRYGEPVDVHVTRLPSGLFPLLPYSAEEWYVTVDPDSVAGEDVGVVLPVYERGRRDEGTTAETLKIFPRCTSCGTHCAHNWTVMGPSTGALVLSYLEDVSHVRNIDVYGMNWNGDLPHNDFRDRTIVRRCCGKCTIHQTPDTVYGAEWGTIQTATTLSVSGLVIVLLLVRHVARCQSCGRLRKKWTRVTRDGVPSPVQTSET